MILAEITENGWITLASSAVILITLIVNRCSDRADKREERNQARLDRESAARIALAAKDELKLAGAAREANIVAAISENTAITKEVAKVITEADQLRSMTTLAKKLGSTDPVFFPVKLPGETYEIFGLSEGMLVYWKSENCETGRAARFLVEGVSSMGFHFHQVTEILSGVRGTLFYETGQETVEITPGVVFSTPADTVHSARFDGPGEVVAHWPEQITDELMIGVWP